MTTKQTFLPGNFVPIDREGNAAALLFGDGSDGDVTISGHTTLTRDMFYNNLTVNANRNLITDGFRVFVKATLTLNGNIRYLGVAGANAAGATKGAGGAAYIPNTLGSWVIWRRWWRR